MCREALSSGFVGDVPVRFVFGMPSESRVPKAISHFHSAVSTAPHQKIGAESRGSKCIYFLFYSGFSLAAMVIYLNVVNRIL